MKYFGYYCRGFMPAFEADGGGGGAADGKSADSALGEKSPDSASVKKGDADNEGKGEDYSDSEKLDRLVQARVEKAIEEERKKSKALSKELDKMKREKLTAEELKKYDDEKRDKELAEREAAITERENRYYAIGAIKKAGLDDGSDTALKIVDLVMGKDSEEIDSKVSALKELVNKIVGSKVNEKFKSAGRIPGRGGTDSSQKEENTLAKTLGKRRAEQDKKSSDILKHYI